MMGGGHGHDHDAYQVGYDKQGLPIGLHLIGRPWGEASLLRLASAIEGSRAEVLEQEVFKLRNEMLKSVRNLQWNLQSEEVAYINREMNASATNENRQPLQSDSLKKPQS
ncbi:hypothetical protein Droror1_Dr00006310 [Drosera rotundifolia]